MTALLQGVRVLDFGRYIAGPYCATLLAEYGADVIRVEKRSGSEDRFPAQVGGGVGALFLMINRNKRSITLDPAAPAGRAVVARLVRSADVVIANMPAATLKAAGLDYDTLRGYRYAVSNQLRSNLVKGASGQAVQNMNLMIGWPEATGLEQVALFP